MAINNGWLWLVTIGFGVITLTPATAADPIVGRWKLDMGSSKFVFPLLKNKRKCTVRLSPVRSKWCSPESKATVIHLDNPDMTVEWRCCSRSRRPSTKWGDFGGAG